MKFFTIVILLFLISCSTELPNRQELIDFYYDAKVDNLLNEKDLQCRKRAIEAAKLSVDSLIALRFNADILDSIKFPDKPVRPDAPEHILDKVQKFEVDSVN